MKKEIFLKKVLSFARENGLWREGDRILAAVSGGPDSLGLLLFLNEIREREHITLGCCCVNHHLRDAAEEETEMVRNICLKLSIPFWRKDVDVLKACSEKKESLETMARELRYQVLGEVMEKENFNLLAVAHHKDDQMETILFRLLRGSGIRGLGGIRPKAGNRIRPFLCVTKEEVGEFISSWPFNPAHDETNDIPDAARNKIRLLLVPRLLSCNPNLRETLSRMAENASDDEDYLEKAAEKEEIYFRKAGESLFYPLDHFLTLHPAIKRRILISAIKRESGRAPDAEGVERFRKLAVNGKKGRTSESGTVMEKAGGMLCFHKGSTREGAELEVSDYFRLIYENWSEKSKHITGKTGIIRCTALETGMGIFSLTIRQLEKPVSTGKNELLLDGDRAGFLHLRKASAKDYMEPNGMEGSKTVFSILQEKRIPAALRHEWPVVADENHIYWTCFLRGSRFARPDRGTKNFLLLTLEWKEKENEHGKSGEGYKDSPDY